MKMLPYEGLTYDDICLVPRYSENRSRSDTDISSGDYASPIIMSPMIHTGTEEMIQYFIEHNMCSVIHRYFDTPKDQFNFFSSILNKCNVIVQRIHGTRVPLDFEDWNPVPFTAVGTVHKWKDWIDHLIKCGIRKFCVDVAHGDSISCVETIRYIKTRKPYDSIIMAGNVAMMDGFAELEQAGADYIRVGIASGGICSTYLNTGVGVPIVTSIIECHKVRRKAKIIADGGIRYAGDIAKAIAVGADYVMCGGLLASTSMAKGPFYNGNKELTEVDWSINCWINGNPEYAEYAGMASTLARSYTKSQKTNASVEGVSGLIPYRGRTDEFLDAVHDNLRASMTYLGARNWQEFSDRAKIMRISAASRIEKDTHVL